MCRKTRLCVYVKLLVWQSLVIDIGVKFFPTISAFQELIGLKFSTGGSDLIGKQEVIVYIDQTSREKHVLGSNKTYLATEVLARLGCWPLPSQVALIPRVETRASKDISWAVSPFHMRLVWFRRKTWFTSHGFRFDRILCSPSLESHLGFATCTRMRGGIWINMKRMHLGRVAIYIHGHQTNKWVWSIGIEACNQLSRTKLESPISRYYAEDDIIALSQCIWSFERISFRTSPEKY